MRVFLAICVYACVFLFLFAFRYKFHLFSKTEHLSSAENQNGDGTGSEGATSKDKTTVVKYMHQHIKSVPGTEEEFVEAVGPFRTRNTRSSLSADPRSGFKREHPGRLKW